MNTPKETILKTLSLHGRQIDMKKIEGFDHLIYFAVNGCNVSFLGDPAVNEYVTEERLMEEAERVALIYKDKPTYTESVAFSALDDDEPYPSFEENCAEHFYQSIGGRNRIDGMD